MMNFSTIRNRQWYLLSGICCFLIGGVVVYGVVSMRDTKLQQNKGLKSSFATGSSRINPQQAWVHKFSTEAEITNKRLDAMEGMLTRVLKLNEAPRGGQDGRSNSQNGLTPGQIDALKEIRNTLQSEQAGAPSNPNAAHSNPDNPSSGNPSNAQMGTNTPVMATPVSSEQMLPPIPGVPVTGNTGADSPGQERLGGSSPHTSSSNSSSTFRSKGLRKISLSLKNARSSAPLKTVDNTIPAGAFAKAVLLGGVDASVSIQASSDPRPALLRVTDLGTLPRKFRSDLEGCHALAACYGDISSERVYMRLEKLTCTERKTGEIVEVKVQGYVAGEDGRAGVRGSVVDRAGETMRNAMMGGFLGGIGELFSQSRSPITFSPVAGLAQTNPLGVGEILKQGAGKGAGNALEKYADFYIKRSEQIQPVLQVSAGRQVDMVFTEGVSIGESVYRQAVGRSNDQGRYQQIQSVTEGGQEKPVSAWVNHSGNTSNSDTAGPNAFGTNKNQVDTNTFVTNQQGQN